MAVRFRNDTGFPLTIDRFGLYVAKDAEFDVDDVDADGLESSLLVTRVDAAAPPAVDPAPTAPGPAEQRPVDADHGEQAPADSPAAEDVAAAAAAVELPPVDGGLDSFNQA